MSPDKEWIAFACGQTIISQPVRDRFERKVVENDNTHQYTGLAFHSSGGLLAVTNNDRTVRMIDAATWQSRHAYAWDIGRMRSIAFAPDGTVAAAGSDTGKVVLWDVEV
ncbi:WD40 repeat domain-containing protein [Limnoglobus roseus]|uniref:WD40 repeat domain-containing protein n=1 Tax=Limnoglobus roseus TaxID=2598579 RepID=UPI0011EACE3A|nr:hypothetical protein [Limnoglobus roseus]